MNNMLNLIAEQASDVVLREALNMPRSILHELEFKYRFYGSMGPMIGYEVMRAFSDKLYRPAQRAVGVAASAAEGELQEQLDG